MKRITRSCPGPLVEFDRLRANAHVAVRVVARESGRLVSSVFKHPKQGLLSAHCAVGPHWHVGARRSLAVAGRAGHAA